MTWRRLWSDERTHAVAAGVVTVAVLAAFTGLRAATFDNFVWLADAWLHGKPYLPHFPGDYIDAIPYHGRAYVYEAPLPAVLMLPLVAIWGLQANETVVSVLLGGVGVGAAYRVARIVGVSRVWACALAAFLLFGTSYAYCCVMGDVWFIAHAGAVAFTLLAIAEWLGSARPVARRAVGAVRGVLPLSDDARAARLRARGVAAGARAALACDRRVARRGGVRRAGRALQLVRWGTVADVGFTKFYRTWTSGARIRRRRSP